MKNKKQDIAALSPGQWAEMMAAAVRLGASDATAGRPQRAGRAIAALCGDDWRIGHVRALRAAYSAGRFHVDTMGRDD